nr:MAG TPA: PolyVal ADP-Ribosyltransferase [Caudoviricetes sp.]
MEIGDVMGDFVKNYKKGEKQRKKYDEYLKNNDRKKLDEEAAAKGREKNKASSSNDKRQQASRNYMRNERKTVKHSGSYGKFGKGQQSFTSRSGSQRKKKTAFERVKDYFTGDYILKKDKDEWNRFDYITNGAMGEWLGGIIRAGEYLGDVTGLTKEKNPQKRKGSQLLREGSEYIDTAKKGTGKLGKVGIDIASQGVMMGLDRAVTLGRGRLSLLPMGVRAFGSSVEQAANSGADLKQQGLYGGLSAGVEIGTEGLFSGGSKLIYGGKGALDRVSETTAKKITDAAKRFVKTDKGQNVLYHAVKAGLAANEEGFEELIADSVNPIIQRISYDDKALKQYGDPQYWKDSAYDYVIGAALGGIMGSGGQAIEYRAGRNMSRQQQEAEINKGLKSDESSESYSYANQLLNQSQRGENILPGQFYDLAKKNAAADNRAAKQYNDIYRDTLDNETFRKAQEGFDEEDVERAKGIAAGRESNAAQQAKAVLLKQGVEETQADEYAQSIGRIVAGTANYTDTEVFQGNDAAKDAFKNVTGFALPADNESTRKQITQYAANATYNMAVNMRADIESEIAAENGGSFRASDGTVVETPVMITSPADVATFRKSVRKYTGEVAEKLAADYTGTVSAGSYTAAFNAFYDAGKIAYSNSKRFNFTWANKINSAWKEYLTANAARDAYLAGIKAARITEEKRVAAKTDIAKKGESKAEDKSNKLSETQKNMAKAMAEKTGLDVTIAEKLHRVVDGANVQLNGAINVAMGTLELSLDSDNLGQALAHELTHYTYALNKEGAKELRDAVLSWYAEEKGMMSLSELLESKKQRYGDEVTAEEEFIADALAGLFSNDKGAESFAQWLTDKSGYSIEQQKSVLQKLIDVIDSIIANIKAMFTGNDLSKVSKDMRQLAKQNQQRAENVRKIYIDALNKASENYASAETVATANESSVKYSKKGEDSSIKKQLRANMEKLKDMKPVADVEYESIKNLNRSEKAKVIMNDYNKKFKDGIDRQDFGHIILREDEVTGSLKYLYTDGEFAAFKALPQVLKRGRVIDEHIDHKKRKIDTVTIAAPVVINGTSGYMAAAVKVGGKNRYHVHRILMPDGSEFEFNKKTEPTGAGMTTSKGRQGSAISPVSNKSISETDKKSNEKYSIKEDSNDNSLSERQREYFKDSKVRDKDGKLMVLYHQTGNDFTVFDTKHEGAGTGDSGTPYGIFLKPTENDIGLSGNKQMPLYANITNPLIAADRSELDRILSENTEYKQVSDEHRKLDIDYKKKFEDAKAALTEYITEYRRKNPNASRSDIYNDPKFEEVWEAEDKIIEAWTAEADALSAKSKEIITNYLEAKGYDGVILEEDKGSFGRKTKAYIALHSEQVKNVDNANPTINKDIRYSIKEYTDEEKKQHIKDAGEYFGYTRKWSETGYVTANGKQLDFSGRHEGGPGGSRDVDHRDIRDALSEDYGGEDYSGSMVQFMSEGNIRISPEINGINMSVMPTKAQKEILSDYISKQHGEVVLDLDTTDGKTVSSTKYPKGTHSNKVLADITAYFEEGKNPHVSELSNFRYSFKVDNKGNVLSEEQQEYFKNSKVRDEKGRLIAVYHGTPSAGFTVFNKNQNYYSDSKELAGTYTNNDGMYEGYLNITNPLIIDAHNEKFSGIPINYIEVDNLDELMEISGLSLFEEDGMMRTSTADIVSMAEDAVDEGIADYDGVIFKNVYDEGGYGNAEVGTIKSNVYVTFESNQFKNIDNTSPTTDKDIRFSIKETDRSTQKLLRENKKYKQLVADLKQQMRLSKGRIPDKGEINKYVNRLRAEYSSKVDKEQLINALTNLYGYMAEKDAKADQVWDVARSIATDIITNSTYNKEISDYAKGILKDIKSSKVALSETQKQEVAYVYGSYTEYKRINKGVNTSDNGIYLDEKWQEWAEVYPELFDAELTEPEQGVRLAEITKALSEDYVNEFGFDLTDATDMLAAEIANEVAQTNEMVTFADKKKQQQAEKIAKEKAKNKEKINAIKQQYKEKYQQGMAEQRAKNNQKLTDQRDKAKEQLARQKAKYEQRAADTRARADRRGIKTQIEKDVKYLTGMLLSPTDTKHIPEGYQSAIARMLAGFDFSTTRTDAWAKKYGHLSRRMLNFANLNAELLKIAESGESDIVVDRFITELADKLSSELDGRRIDSLTNAELQDIKTLLKAVRYGIANINNTFSDNIKQTRAEAGDNIISETMQIKDKKHRSEMFKMFDDFLNSSNVKPMDFFEVMGGTAKEVFGAVVDGFDKHIRNVDAAMKYIQSVADKKTLNRLSNDKMRPTEFKLSSGDTVELLPSQVMSLYCLMKRPEAVEHITKGGIVPTSLKYKKKFKTQGIIDDKRKLVTYTDAVRIINSLTEEEKTIADKLQKFMAEDCAAWGNETSMKIHGYKKFNDPNYFPMKSDKDFLESRQTDKAELMPKLWTAGFTKALTPGANNPIMLDDIFNVVTKHITEMSMYNSLAPALLDFERIYNYKQRGEGGTYYTGTTVKEQIRRAYGDKATNYINKLMKDLNNANKRDDKVDTKIPNKLIANYKKAKIGFNFRVLIQQPTAIVRSAMMINPKYLIAAQGKPAIKEMQEHCPIAKWKGWGFYQTDVAPSMKEIILGQESRLDKVFMDVYGKADDFTWSYIWKAVKKEVQKNNPDIEAGSQEFWDKCNERARAIYYRTQVVDSMLSRSQIMRNDDSLMKIATSFMAEPTTTFNMMRTETIKTAKEWAAGDKKAAAKRMGTLIPVFITNAVAVSVAAAIADYMRDTYTGDDDDDDENLTPLQKYLKYTTKNLNDNANPMNMLPFLRDIYSLFGGYEVTRMDMAAFTAIQKDVERLQKTYEQGEDAKYTYEYCIRQLTLHCGEAFGIPAANITREIETAVKTAFPEKGKALVDSFMYANPDDVNRKGNYAALLSEDESKSQSALEAIERDAETKYQKYIDEGKSESQAMSAVRSSLSNYYKGAYQAAETGEKSMITSRISQIKVNGRSVWEYADGTTKDFSEWDETE